MQWAKCLVSWWATAVQSRDRGWGCHYHHYAAKDCQRCRESCIFTTHCVCMWGKYSWLARLASVCKRADLFMSLVVESRVCLGCTHLSKRWTCRDEILSSKVGGGGRRAGRGGGNIWSLLSLGLIVAEPTQHLPLVLSLGF